ncbi:hypothetical protein [Frondihabitans sp. Leaf304]|uniref:hypothetical protein n=1 Tax=Frondihabitans sp. Leaf304 TaxID=1736329 RepID=UPI0006F991E0|nr:hypothetical protein [Frondihabitans sp. Leaf304]KQQ28564.1 hypothetical protein ASF54_07860 [Frondihabitans sp. Leaf304]
MATPPGGRIGAWFNVIVCGFLCVATPIAAVTNTHPLGTGILVALIALAICVFMETQFVRILIRQNRAAKK